jgi:hypothetical protein
LAAEPSIGGDPVVGCVYCIARFLEEVVT